MAKTKTEPVKQVPDTAVKYDPYNINARILARMDAVLHRLEETPNIPLRDEIMSLGYLARVQAVFVGLRKEHKDEPAAGSAVRKYAQNFAAHAARGGKKNARSAPAAAPAPDLEWDDDDSSFPH